MGLIVQIYSFLFSFCYGIFFFILLEINYKLIYSDCVFIKILYSFIFIIFNALLFFIILYKINNGIIHIYFIIMILIGYIISYFLFYKFFKK